MSLINSLEGLMAEAEINGCNGDFEIEVPVPFFAALELEMRRKANWRRLGDPNKPIHTLKIMTPGGVLTCRKASS